MDNFFEEKTKNQGTSHSEASQEVNGDMASWEELVELDDVQLATVVGGIQKNREPEPWFVKLTLPQRVLVF